MLMYDNISERNGMIIGNTQIKLTKNKLVTSYIHCHRRTFAPQYTGQDFHRTSTAWATTPTRSYPPEHRQLRAERVKSGGLGGRLITTAGSFSSASLWSMAFLAEVVVVRDKVCGLVQVLGGRYQVKRRASRASITYAVTRLPPSSRGNTAADRKKAIFKTRKKRVRISSQKQD
jgi:hypothetical protein